MHVFIHVCIHSANFIHLPCLHGHHFHLFAMLVRMTSLSVAINDNYALIHSKKNPNTMRNFIQVNAIAGLTISLVVFQLAGIRLDKVRF